MFRNPDKYRIITVDTETNGEDVRDGRGIAYGVSVASRRPDDGILVSCNLPFRHPGQANYPEDNLELSFLYELKEAIESYTGVLVFHNAKFDLESLRTLGINYQGKFICTMLWSHLVNENFPFKKSLDNCGKYYLDDAGKKQSDEFNLFIKLWGWAGLPSQVSREYAEYDAVLTHVLMEHLATLMEKEELFDYWYNHKMKFNRVVIAMERRGIRIDKAMCRRMLAHGELTLSEVEEILGLNPGGRNDLKELLLNKLNLPVVKRSPKTGDPSFDKYAMEIYEQILERKDDKTAELILTYRGWQKACSSNYKPYLELCSPDGRLRPNYKLHGTKTGRMSCEKPNLQQIPRSGDKPWNGDMKAAFLPEDGWGLWEFDYGQLEFRLASAYGQERRLLDVFADDRDIFTEMAETLGFTRHDTKTLTYTIQYGGGVTRISNVFGVSMERAGEIKDTFYTQYPGLHTVSNLAKVRTIQNGKVRVWSGRYRHFLHRKDDAHKAFNAVIQGGAADIVESVMIRLFEQVDNEEECRMLLTVHDSVIFEIKNGYEDKYIPRIVEIMEDVQPDFGVRFKVDAHRFGE